MAISECSTLLTPTIIRLPLHLRLRVRSEQAGRFDARSRFLASSRLGPEGRNIASEDKKPVLSSYSERQKPPAGVSAPHDHGWMSSLESGPKPNKKALFRGRSLIIAHGLSQAGYCA